MVGRELQMCCFVVLVMQNNVCRVLNPGHTLSIRQFVAADSWFRVCRLSL